VRWWPEKKDGQSPPGRRSPVLNQAWKVRLAHLGLWALLGLAVVGALGRGGRSEASPAAPAAAQQAPNQIDVGPAGFAQTCVTAYLEAGEATQSTLAPCFAEPPDLSRIAAGQFYVARTSVWRIQPQGAGYWSVTVGVDMLEAVKGKYQPAGTRFYMLGVQGGQDGYVAVSLPAEVQRPATPAPRPPIINQLGPPMETDAPTQALTRFFAWYLAGERVADRYTSPGNDLLPVDPPACTTAKPLAVGFDPDGSGASQYQARVQVECTDAQGHLQRLEYALDLAQRANRWEVTALQPAPSLAAPSKGVSTQMRGPA
jgi:conjugative transposon protein TcpC